MTLTPVHDVECRPFGIGRSWRKVVTHAQIELVGLQVSNGQRVLIGPLQWAILRKYRLAFLQMRCKSLASVCSGEAENLERG